MKEKFCNLIEVSDLLGQNINLTIKKRRTSKTVLGGILTFIIVIFLCCFSWIILQDLINKTNPSVSLEQQILTIYPTLQLSNQTLSTYFALKIMTCLNEKKILYELFNHFKLCCNFCTLLSYNLFPFFTSWKILYEIKTQIVNCVKFEDISNFCTLTKIECFTFPEFRTSQSKNT